jgi:hypothetical protein
MSGFGGLDVRESNAVFWRGRDSKELALEGMGKRVHLLRHVG